MAYFRTIKSVSTILRLRSVARLSTGETAEALADIEFNERLAARLSHNSTVLSDAIRRAVETIGVQILWNGLVDHRWAESDLAVLQNLFASRDPRGDCRKAIRGELVFGVGVLSAVIQHPEEKSSLVHPDMEPDSKIDSFYLFISGKSTLRANQINMVRWYDTLDVQVGRWASDQLTTRDLGQTSFLRQLRVSSYPSTFLLKNLPGTAVPAMVAADKETAISRMAVIACALERYRIFNGRYPAVLEDLKSKYLSVVPLDPCSNRPFEYSPTPDGWYRLRSIGPGPQTSPAGFAGLVYPDNDGDWLWPLPIPMENRLF